MLPGESGLLGEVLSVYDVWSIWKIRPRVFLRVRHSLGAYVEGGVKLGRRGSRDGERPQSSIEER